MQLKQWRQKHCQQRCVSVGSSQIGRVAVGHQMGGIREYQVVDICELGCPYTVASNSIDDQTPSRDSSRGHCLLYRRPFQCGPAACCRHIHQARSQGGAKQTVWPCFIVQTPSYHTLLSHIARTAPHLTAADWQSNSQIPAPPRGLPEARIQTDSLCQIGARRERQTGCQLSNKACAQPIGV